MKVIKSGMLGGIVLFLWGALSWMVLPWHEATLHHFTNDKTVLKEIASNAPKSGMYIAPTDMGADHAQQPYVFASIHLQGVPSSMALMMSISLLTQIIAAILIAYLLSKVTDLSYVKRVGLVLVFALAAGIVTYVPLWNWFCFDTTYALVEIADLLIGWFFAGLVLAKLSK